MAALALIGAIVSWATWRRHPLFSVHSTLRFLVIIGTAASAYMWAMISLCDYSERFSQDMQLAVILSGAAIGCIVTVSVIVAMTGPKLAPLRASTKRVNIYRRRLIPWAYRLAWTLLLPGALAIGLKGTAQILAEMLACFCSFVGILLLLVGWITARRFDHWISAVEADPWVRWTYTPEQWKRWTENAPMSSRKSLVKAEPSVYFGREGVFANGEFTTWLDMNEFLLSAFIPQSEPRTLTLSFLKIRAGVGGAVRAVTHDVHLPFPEGRDVTDDLARLHRELRATCTTSRVALATIAAPRLKTSDV